LPLDHNVSQVHLRNFYSPTLGGIVYAIRKNDLKSFTTNAQSVCRIENGSTNPYLREERAVEEFLKGIEPRVAFCIRLPRGNPNRTSDRPNSRLIWGPRIK
jgi:hypothetical protein